MVGGIVLAIVAPRLLTTLVRRGVGAQIVLLTWAGLLCASVASIAVPAVSEMMHRCWLLLHDGRSGPTDVVVGVLSAAALLASTLKFEGLLTLQLRGEGPMHLDPGKPEIIAHRGIDHLGFRGREPDRVAHHSGYHRRRKADRQGRYALLSHGGVETGTRTGRFYIRR